MSADIITTTTISDYPTPAEHAAEIRRLGKRVMLGRHRLAEPTKQPDCRVAARAEPALRPSALAIFIARAEARALLWQIGEFDLHQAVDELQRAAERDGIVLDIGQDATQKIIADAFAKVREDAP
jgi:hypothetical protein